MTDLDLDAIVPTWHPGTRYLDDRKVVAEALARPCSYCGETDGHVPGCLRGWPVPPTRPCRSCKREVNNPDRAERHAEDCGVANPRQRGRAW